MLFVASAALALLASTAVHGTTPDRGQLRFGMTADGAESRSLLTAARVASVQMRHILRRSPLIPSLQLATVSDEYRLRHSSATGTPATLAVALAPAFFPALYHPAFHALRSQSSPTWPHPPALKRMLVPDIADKATVIALALMTFDDYKEPDDISWVDIGNGWNVSDSFGWDTDGIRGYVFADDSASVVIVSFKGTNAAFLGIGGGRTAAKDKFNDNMMFSCCCAKVDYTWHPICDCPTNHNQCSQTCVNRQAHYGESYYDIAQDIYSAVRQSYPTSDIWFTGHSLGGSLATLLGLTNNLPAVAFEAPGELMFASRLNILPPASALNWFWPSPKPKNPATPDKPATPAEPGKPEKSPPTHTYSYEMYRSFFDSVPIYHFGNNGDPIFLGVCTGPSSACYYAGYAMESKCHIGKTCIYDIDNISRRMTPEKFLNASAHMDIRNHRIEKALEWYMVPYDGVPKCQVETGCVDCELWEFS